MGGSEQHCLDRIGYLPLSLILILTLTLTLPPIPILSSHIHMLQNLITNPSCNEVVLSKLLEHQAARLKLSSSRCVDIGCGVCVVPTPLYATRLCAGVWRDFLR
jgi:hypothetical protein